jgi:amicyanin
MGNLARTTLALVVVLAVVCAGCGSSSDSQSQAATAAVAPSGTVQVAMKVLEFAPAAVDAKVGQKVTWTNADSSPHNVTYVSGPRFKSSRLMMAPGETFAIKLTQPGTIHYFCTLHPWMKATIVVSR